MKKKVALFLALNLITITPLIRADFFDLAGSILWHGDSQGFCGMFKDALENKYDWGITFDVDQRLVGSSGNWADYHGWTLLMMAAHKGIAPIVSAILEAGADILLENAQGQKAVDIAIAAGHEDIAALITEYSQPKSSVVQDFNGVMSDLAGNILWHGKSDNGKNFCELFKNALLKRHGCQVPFDVNMTLAEKSGDWAIYHGWTLLMMAAHEGIATIVEEILEAEPNVWLKNPQDQTASDIAMAAGHQHIVELIAKYSQPKSLVHHALRAVVSNINMNENREVALANAKSILPVELYEQVVSELNKSK